MAKFVILEFGDDALADKFIAATQEAGEVTLDERKFPDNSMTYLKCFVRGVFRKPTKFCDCRGRKTRGFTRGKKYGWWVCDQCKCPTRSWARGDHWFLALGRNLLPIDARAPEYRGDGVFARSVKACPECHNPLVVEVGHAACTTYCPTCKKDV